ncbi:MULTISPECIES: hypothetical protein [Pantoea]|uniref:hypothetical protein n=1 Tax=Pantoea TaxID=53335 RepID=UPI000CF52AC6|nr:MULTISPECIES: hypothetical protein [Pantoea]PQK87686.1 hypothetical protein CG432_15085 [Pantoea ananatis]TWD39077.1 hypothetical protein FBY13_107232 [Pantoea sp. SJZ147]
MASDWNDELDKYENGRSFGEDLRDSVRAAFSATTLVSSITKAASKPCDEYKSSLKYSWEKEGFFKEKDGF